VSVGWYDFFFALKKNSWIFLIGTVAFLVLIPFFTAGLPGDSIFNIEVTHDQMKFRLIHGDAVYAVVCAAIGLGLLMGIALFRFLQDKKETTIFLSMGITRTRLFVNRLGAGILILTGSIVLPMLLSLWLNIQALGGYQCLVRNCIYLSAGIVVVACISMLVAAAVSFVAGTVAETLVYWTGIMSAPTIICYSLNLLMKQLFWGNAWGVSSYTESVTIKQSLLEYFASFNPLIFFVNELETHAMFYRPLSTDTPESIQYNLLIGWCIVLVLLVLVAWVLLKYRKAEVAEIAGMNRVLPEIITALSGLLIFSIVFSFLYDFHVLLAGGLGCVSFWIVHVFWRRTIFAGSARWKACFGSAICQTALLGCLCLIFYSGCFHSAERFLQNGEVTEAEVTYVGAPTFLYEEASGSSTGRGYYLMSSITLDTEASIEKVREIQLLFETEGRQKMESGENVEDTVIPYDISFSYTDADGETHEWYYDRASYAQLEELLSLENEEQVKTAQEQLFSTDEEENSDAVVWAKEAYESGEIFLTSSYFTDTYRLTLTDEERQELMESVQKDIETLSLEELYFPEDETEAVLMFSQNGEYDCKYYSYHLDNAFLYLTSAYANTLSWLEENELLSLVQDEPEVEYILMQKMDPYIGMNDISYPMGMYFMAYCADTEDEFLIEKDFGNKYTITDEDEIEEILEGLKDGYYMTRGGYLAVVKLAGEERYRYLFLPADCVPDFIRG
jgi:ABC-2 type transport system permease protein